MLNWHVAKVEPHKGMIAEKCVAAKGFEVFNPKIVSLRKPSRGRKQTEIIRPYISGYLFVRFDVLLYGWQDLNALPGSGLKGLMYSASEIPARVRDEALLPLMSLCSSEGYVIEQQADRMLFEVGATVKVLEGPFVGFEGPVRWSTYDRLKVLVHMFGRPSEVEGSAGMFELVRKAETPARVITLAKKDVESII